MHSYLRFVEIKRNLNNMGTRTAQANYVCATKMRTRLSALDSSPDYEHSSDDKQTFDLVLRIFVLLLFPLGRQPVRRYSDTQNIRGGRGGGGGGHTEHRREWNTRTVPGLYFHVIIQQICTEILSR